MSVAFPALRTISSPFTDSGVSYPTQWKIRDSGPSPASLPHTAANSCMPEAVTATEHSARSPGAASPEAAGVPSTVTAQRIDPVACEPSKRVEGRVNDSVPRSSGPSKATVSSAGTAGAALSAAGASIYAPTHCSP